MYTEGNPINNSDPSGLITEKQASKADLIIEKMKAYGIYVYKDWGYSVIPHYYSLPRDIQNKYPMGCNWIEGNWNNVKELQLTFDAVKIMAQKLGGIGGFKAIYRNKPIEIVRLKEKKNTAGLAPYPPFNNIFGDVLLYDGSFRSHYSQERTMGYVVHELAHVWDSRYRYEISLEYADHMNVYTKLCDGCAKLWIPDYYPSYFPTEYSKTNEIEYWAESITVYVFPSLANLNTLTSLSETFIRKKINNTP